MAVRDYDAIIVGASFAGLAVARRLRGEVLLLDRNEVGTVQTSACGTPLWIPRAFGVEESILAVHDRLVVRSPTRTVVYDISAVPFCTFDYEKFCRGLLDQCRARFLRVGVTGVRNEAVVTMEGSFRAPVVVDCSGWRRVLINGGSVASPTNGFSFGLETRTGFSEDGLVLWLDDRVIPHGLGWIFPVGRGSLIGLGSYAGNTKLRPRLDRFLATMAEAPTTYHGTYFPNRMLRPTSGRIFAVGDAAGQCLPLTAEGIRPALYFGEQCARIVQRIIDGALTVVDGLAHYRRLVGRYRWAYLQLGLGQLLASGLPSRWFGGVAALANRSPLREYWWPRYGNFGRSRDGQVMPATSTAVVR
ncbi:MAG: NAD(P)/FAD-dependent oxidoreductase [Candidatus Rokubacteria bacterium]|nr:NAD(P)/FAD-dependent oxidoreductase [Candidatus Rokubacteria bacterium]